ncbi:MAG: signal peptidase II [Bacteroidia bacterium]
MGDASPSTPENLTERGAIQLFLQRYRYFLFAGLVVFIDQAVKIAIKFSMIPYENIAVVGDTVNINFIENKGAAFGLTVADLLQRIGVNVEDDTAKLVLTLFSLLAVMLIAYFLQAVRNAKSGLPYFLALILGGAIGNIIDRVFYGVWFSGINDYEGGLLHGRVVDMFYVNLVHGKFLGMEMNLLPVFNIADAAITIGIVAIILFQRRFFKKAADEQEEQSSAALAETSGNPVVSEQGLGAGE